MDNQGGCMPIEEKLEFESTEDCETIGKYLHALKQGFAKGLITLTSEDRSLTLKPDGFLSFQLAAKKKAGETKITIKISWKDEHVNVKNPSISID